jgi:hypothetical protein
MILLAPCIIDFIGPNGLRGPVGGRGPWTLLGPEMARAKQGGKVIFTTLFPPPPPTGPEHLPHTTY